MLYDKLLLFLLGASHFNEITVRSNVLFTIVIVYFEWSRYAQERTAHATYAGLQTILERRVKRESKRFAAVHTCFIDIQCYVVARFSNLKKHCR